jgi:hypothetical protein
MKTDRVLTIDEYLNEICVLPKQINPPTPEARHISVAVEENPHVDATEHDRRCNRWGHPCEGCQVDTVQTPGGSPDFVRKNK